MKGTNTAADLQFGLAEEQNVGLEISHYYGVTLRKLQNEHIGDFVDNEGKIYEMKSDPNIGVSGKFMVELFASIYPARFEKGWAYRYERVDFLCFYTSSKIWVYDWKSFRQKFWNDDLKRFNGRRGWSLQCGVHGNEAGVVALIPIGEANVFLRDIIRRQPSDVRAARGIDHLSSKLEEGTIRDDSQDSRQLL